MTNAPKRGTLSASHPVSYTHLDSEELTIVGIVQPKADATSTILHSGLDYLHDLTYYVIDQAANSEIVRQQLADPDINVLTRCV